MTPVGQFLQILGVKAAEDLLARLAFKSCSASKHQYASAVVANPTPILHRAADAIEWPAESFYDAM